jgi:hypothetical protein
MQTLARASFIKAKQFFHAIKTAAKKIFSEPGDYLTSAKPRRICEAHAAKISAVALAC